MVSVDRIAREVVESGVAPSAAVGFAKWIDNDRRWDITVGGATEAIYDLASLTKPMTAVAIARSGLSHGTRLASLVVEVKGTPAGEKTIEELLAHRAGLEAHVLLPADGALEAAARSLRADPRGAVYSDLGYVLAGVALARHVGARDAGEAIERLVVVPLSPARFARGTSVASLGQGRFAPLDLGTARALRAAGIGFDERVQPTEGDLRGIVHDENARLLTGEGGSGHAGMFGSIRALLAFACDAADFVARDENSWIVRPWDDGATNRAGFDGKSARGSSAGERHGPHTFGHLGFTGTSFWIDPDARIVTALLTNRVHPTRENVRIREARPRVHDALFDSASR